MAQPLPEKITLKTVDDRGCERKCGQCDGSASANSTVEQMRYQNGVPHHRLAQIQDAAGTPLPASSQSRMVDQVDASAQLIEPLLEAAAANGSLVGADDSVMGFQSNKTAQRKKGQLKAKIASAAGGNGLDEVGKKQPSAGESARETGKKTQTTVIISEFIDRAVLVKTGAEQAGANVKALLEKLTVEGRPKGSLPSFVTATICEPQGVVDGDRNQSRQ